MRSSTGPMRWWCGASTAGDLDSLRDGVRASMAPILEAAVPAAARPLVQRVPGARPALRRPGAALVSARSERAVRLLDLLAAEHPDAHIALDYATPLELLVATILSAQCTDARVNMVTPALFARCRTPADYLALRAGRAGGADPADRLLPQQGACHPRGLRVDRAAFRRARCRRRWTSW